jgi:hypothetical protein
MYNPRSTSDAVSLGAFKLFSMNIVASDATRISPRFGAVSKNIQPAGAEATKQSIAADVGAIVFTLDDVEYRIDPTSVKEVGGRKYR